MTKTADRSTFVEGFSEDEAAHGRELGGDVFNVMIGTGRKRRPARTPQTVNEPNDARHDLPPMLLNRYRRGSTPMGAAPPLSSM